MISWIKNKFFKKKKNLAEKEKIELTEFALSAEALRHSRSYSEMLSIYVKATRRNGYIKDILKVLFFLITIGSLVAIIVIFAWTLKYAFDFFGNVEDINKISLEAILSIVTVILPAISSLIVAFIKIPKIIAKYLFNIEEDNYMNSVIKNIQNHDQSMFAMEHKINVTLAENKTESDDDSFEDSPKKENQSEKTSA